MLGQPLSQALEVTQPERHRAAAGDAVGRVGEADQPLALGVLEQLNQ